MSLDDQHLPTLKESNSDSEPGVELPRLSIIELMVVTAAMAIAFAFQEAMTNMNVGMQSKSVWFDTVHRIQYALVFGLPIAAVYRFVLQKRTTGQFLLQPGHWILFSILISVVGFMLPVAIQKAIGFDDTTVGGLLGNWHFIASATFSFISAAVLFRGAMRWGWAWRTMLLLMAVSLLVSGIQMTTYAYVFGSGNWVGSVWVFSVFGWIDTAIKSLLFIALALVLSTDLKSTKKRDLWHWAGVLLLFALNVVIPILNYIFMRFLGQ